MDEQKIIDYLVRHGAQDITFRGDEYRSTCPFHGGANSSSLRIKLDGRVTCFACGFFDTIEDSTNSVVREKENKKNIDNSEIAELIVKDMHLCYTAQPVTKRCDSENLLKKSGTGYATNGLYKGKTIFQYRDVDGKLHGFKARVNREFTVENFYEVGSVFFLEHMFDRNKTIATIVEGEWDGLRLLQLGFQNILVLGGSSLTKGKIDKLDSLTKTVFLALDNDDVGRYKTKKIGYRLNGNHAVYVLPYERKDPYEIQDRFEFLKAFNNAKRI